MTTQWVQYHQGVDIGGGLRVRFIDLTGGATLVVSGPGEEVTETLAEGAALVVGDRRIELRSIDRRGNIPPQVLIEY